MVRDLEIEVKDTDCRSKVKYITCKYLGYDEMIDAATKYQYSDTILYSGLSFKVARYANVPWYLISCMSIYVHVGTRYLGCTFLNSCSSAAAHPQPKLGRNNQSTAPSGILKR
jgi:hypothetical protein